MRDNTATAEEDRPKESTAESPDTLKLHIRAERQGGRKSEEHRERQGEEEQQNSSPIEWEGNRKETSRPCLLLPPSTTQQALG